MDSDGSYLIRMDQDGPAKTNGPTLLPYKLKGKLISMETKLLFIETPLGHSFLKSMLRRRGYLAIWISLQP